MIEQVERPSFLHKHPIRGEATMMKEYHFEDSKVVIYSPIANFSDEEKKQWFEAEKTKGNPILKEIEEAVNACYQD
ncbi:hypothetical protein LJR015_004053 [Peribacillus frigoritolerans]|uniref:hypothetical protein n=1 Tax=Peribacillus frigoritolerans TaxID=450367 RepID=UPI003ECC6D03